MNWIPAEEDMIRLLLNGATSRFVHLEKFSINFQVRHLHSMSIFCIPNQPRSFLVYSSHFGVFLSYQTSILWFPRFEGNFHMMSDLGSQLNCTLYTFIVLGKIMYSKIFYGIVFYCIVVLLCSNILLF